MPPPNSVGNMRPKCSLTWLKVRAEQVARLEVDLAGSRLRACRSPRSGRRSARRGRPCARAPWSSSSSAARLTAPSAAISRLQAVDLALQARQLDAAVLDRLRRPPRRSACAASSCSRYCAPPSCAACSSSCSSVMRSRSGCSSCSSCRRRSSARRSCARQVVVVAALARRAPARARACSASASCRPACAGGVGEAARARRCELRRRLRGWRATCCAAVSIARCSSPRARRQRALRELRLLRLALERALLLARVGERALGVDHALRRARRGAPARRRARMSSSSKRASPAARRSLELLELRIELGAARRSSCSRRALRLLGQLRQAQQLDLQLVRARSAPRRPRARAPTRRCDGVGVRRLGAHQRGCAPPRRSAPARAAGCSRFSISCARASRPACSESGA